MGDKLAETSAMAMPPSAQADEIPSAADGTLLSRAAASPCRPWPDASDNFSAPCCRWALAGVLSSVVHGLMLLLLGGMRMPVPGTYAPSHAAISVTLASPRVVQADTPGDRISAALPEEPQPAEGRHQKVDHAKEQAKPKIKEGKHPKLTRHIVTRSKLDSGPMSSTISSSAPQPLPASGSEASTGVITPAASEGRPTFQNEVFGSSSSRTDGRSSAGSTGGQDTAPLPLSEVAEAPVLISRAVPHYPEHARLLGVEGLVRLEAILNREGRIEQDIKVLESIPLLDDAASVALKQWRFKPARDESGRPVRVILEVPFRFTLK